MSGDPLDVFAPNGRHDSVRFAQSSIMKVVTGRRSHCRRCVEHDACPAQQNGLMKYFCVRRSLGAVYNCAAGATSSISPRCSGGPLPLPTAPPRSITPPRVRPSLTWTALWALWFLLSEDVNPPSGLFRGVVPNVIARLVHAIHVFLLHPPRKVVGGRPEPVFRRAFGPTRGPAMTMTGYRPRAGSNQLWRLVSHRPLHGI
jgi:hypothetical protein